MRCYEDGYSVHVHVFNKNVVTKDVVTRNVANRDVVTRNVANRDVVTRDIGDAGKMLSMEKLALKSSQ